MVHMSDPIYIAWNLGGGESLLRWDGRLTVDEYMGRGEWRERDELAQDIVSAPPDQRRVEDSAEVAAIIRRTDARANVSRTPTTV